MFSSHQSYGLMNRLMGHNVMRKDANVHLSERKVMFPSVSSRAVTEHRTALFQAHADRIVGEWAPAGAAAVGRMPQGRHQPDQHALSGHGCVVAPCIQDVKFPRRRRGSSGAFAKS